MFSKLVVFFVLLIQLISFTNGLSLFSFLFDPLNLCSESNENPYENEINIYKLKNSIIDEMKYQKELEEKQKFKLIFEKEEKLKNELTQKIKANIIKQIEIDNENNKFTKYYDIVKKNNRMEIDEDEEENLIKFATNKLNNDE